MTPKPTLTVETHGSMWMLDENEMVYLRMPKTEGPRQSPPGEDWGGADAGHLQDLVWHPFTRWALHDTSTRIVIYTPEPDAPDLCVSAPLPMDEYRRLLVHHDGGSIS